MVDDFIAQL